MNMQPKRLWPTDEDWPEEWNDEDWYDIEDALVFDDDYEDEEDEIDWDDYYACGD